MFFFFNDTATTEIYTLALHDALPICLRFCPVWIVRPESWTRRFAGTQGYNWSPFLYWARSEEHTSELQSLTKLVCRLLLEKKNSILCYICFPTSS